MLKTVVGIVLFGLSSMPAQSNNAISDAMFSLPWNMYVECLGENVTGTLYIAARVHSFETPSGTTHFVDNWTVHLELGGVSTGREWLGKGKSPAGGHSAKSGESFFYTDNVKLVPVPVYGIANGPSWRWNITVQQRFDEEGNLTKDFINFVAGDMRCLGPN